MQQEWEGEKRKYERELQETHEGQGAIIQQIEESKAQVQKLDNKAKEFERQKRLVETELEDLQVDKKIKLKELSDQRLSKNHNAQQEVDDLEAESRGKDDELSRIQKLLKDRKDLLERSNMMQNQSPVKPAATMLPAAQVYNQASDLRYEQLSHEIRSIKVQMATMNDIASKEMLFHKVVNRRPLIQESGIRVNEQPI